MGFGIASYLSAAKQLLQVWILKEVSSGSLTHVIGCLDDIKLGSKRVYLKSTQVGGHLCVAVSRKQI